MIDLTATMFLPVSGVQLLTYRPAGPATYADVANDASARHEENHR